MTKSSFYLNGTVYNALEKSAEVLAALQSAKAATEAAAATISALSLRKVLSAPRTIWYRNDGDDSHTGDANTALTALRTAQKAYDMAMNELDLAGFNITIKCGNAAGTVFTSGIVTSKSPVGNAGAGAVTWDGNGSIVRVTNGSCLDLGAGNQFGGFPQITIQNIRLETISSGNTINARGGLLLSGPGLVFGPSAGNHVFGGHQGQMGLGNYEIAGSPGVSCSHIYGYSNFFYWTEGSTTTISAPITVFTYVTLIQGAAGLMGGQTFVNKSNVTGARFLIGQGSYIDTGTGGDFTYLPGNFAGSVVAGGFYDSETDNLQWTAFTPTITPDGGSFTSASVAMRYKKVGNVVFYAGALTVTTVGTATGRVTLSLPVPPYSAMYYTGSAFNFDGGLAALAHIGFLTPGALCLSSVASGSPVTGGSQRVLFSGQYEAA